MMGIPAPRIYVSRCSSKDFPSKNMGDDYHSRMKWMGGSSRDGRPRRCTLEEAGRAGREAERDGGSDLWLIWTRYESEVSTR